MLTPASLRALLVMNLLLLLPAVAVPRLPTAGKPASPVLPTRLHWMRQETALEPTWPDQPRFTSDAACRPVVAGALLLATSSRHDTLTALDAASGELRWRFTAAGPIRFAPAVWDNRAYLVSDDGHLYCLDIGDGEVLWKVRGGPADRRVLGNERLISAWPARGAPVVAREANGEATVYFAAGIWPFMGIFLHALDARSGTPRWQNSGEGAAFLKQPHQTEAFAGIAPQGTLVVAGDRLLVPGGRSVPACFDRHTGRRLHYRLADGSKLGGGPDLLVAGGVYVNGGGGFDLETGEFLGLISEPSAVSGMQMLSVRGTTCRAFTPDRQVKPLSVVGAVKAVKKAVRPGEDWLGTPTGSAKVPATTALLAAHGRVYGGGPGGVYALDLPLQPDGARPVWQHALEGTPLHLTASADRLFVSTREGRLYAFAAGEQAPRLHPQRLTPLSPHPAGSDAARMAARTGVREGYAVVWGAAPPLVEELLRTTALRLIVLDADEERVETLRDRLREAGMDGKRASVLHATPAESALPPYLASLVVADPAGAGVEPDDAFFDRVWSTLRPYGGVACLKVSSTQRAALRRRAQAPRDDGTPRLEEHGEWLQLHRDGPLPGAADWTHQHADAANSRVSADRRVKAPLGVLWFGGPGHQGVLPRHGHGPIPQVCQGRLIIEGPDRLRAIDIYTGRLLWEKELPGVGKVYDNTSHQPGANATGSNYVSTPEGVHVAYRDRCLLLELATGRTLRDYRLPAAGKRPAPVWTYLSVAGDYLIGGDGGLGPTSGLAAKKLPAGAGHAASRRLTVLDRRSGKVLWSSTAAGGFRHNAICAGNGRLYTLDRAPTPTDTKKATKAAAGQLRVFDLRSGKPLWQSPRDAFGTWLSYSLTHDVLIEAGMMSRDTLADEPAGMRAYRGRDGQVLWHEKGYFGPALIHGERILKGGDARAGSGTACDLRSGKPHLVADPLTGTPVEWRWQRTYGCNTPAASEHLVLFRSGAAGFFDLCNDSGTANLGGFRSSCTFNLIPAGGVLTVPDYTRTCTCGYQQQTSVGLIHDPDTEVWTFTTARAVPGPVRRVGVNLGAPGSHKDDSGTLWLAHPPVGGPSPKLAVAAEPATTGTFRLHSSRVGGALPQVAASGMRGLTRLTIPLGGSGRYTVRLAFLEPDERRPGERRFDVAVQGETVLPRFDVSSAAGGPRRGVVREFRGVRATGDLTVQLTPCRDTAVPETVLSGVEVVAEER